MIVYFRNETEFAIVAKRDSVLRIDLNDFNLVETLPVLNIGSAVAIDFDKTTETLYWSDVNKDHIKVLEILILKVNDILVRKITFDLIVSENSIRRY